MRRAGLLIVLLLACGGGAREASPDLVFDGERAFADLKAQVAIGPRPAGSAGAEAARQLIGQRLRQAGWPVERESFAARRPGGGEVQLVNLRAALPGDGGAGGDGAAGGEAGGRIWIGAHYDTKAIAGLRFVGANDGASGVALLLELARVLGRQPRAFTVELLFFDGEEAFGPDITRADGLYGSRFLAASAAADGTLAEVRALIVVDMLADRDLNLATDSGSAPWLRALARERAPDLFAAGPSLQVVDDHWPFAERGLADVLLLIDFQYGARRTPGPTWHTAADDLPAVSAESLNRAGELLVQLLEGVEERLLRSPRAREGRGR